MVMLMLVIVGMFLRSTTSLLFGLVSSITIFGAHNQNLLLLKLGRTLDLANQTKLALFAISSDIGQTWFK
jgi:hypothetical protein